MKRTVTTHTYLGTGIADAFWLAGGTSFWIGVVFAGGAFLGMGLWASEEPSAPVVAYWPLLLIALISFGLGWVVRFGLRGIALKRYRSSAESGDARALCALAERYDNGVGVPKNFSTAANFYLEAAEQGVADAQYEVGARYETGVGLSQDNTRAVEWYGRAAEQGNILAQQRLAKIHDLNQDNETDDTTAARWHRHLKIQRRLNRIRMKRHGVIFLLLTPLGFLVSLYFHMSEAIDAFHVAIAAPDYSGPRFPTIIPIATSYSLILITGISIYLLIYLFTYVLITKENFKLLVRIALAILFIAFPWLWLPN